MAKPPYKGGPPWGGQSPPPAYNAPPPPNTAVPPTPPYVGNVGSYTDTASSASSAFPVAANAGDGVVLFVAVGASITSVAAKDNYGSAWYTYPGTFATNPIYVLWCPYLLGSGPTVTVTSSTAIKCIGWLQIVGGNPQFFIDGINVVNLSAASVSPFVRTSSPADLIVAGAVVPNASDPYTFPAAYRSQRIATPIGGSPGFELDVAWTTSPQPIDTAGTVCTGSGGTTTRSGAAVAIRTLPYQPNVLGPPVPLPIRPLWMRTINPPPFPEPQPAAATTPIAGVGVSATVGFGQLAGTGALAALGVTTTEATAGLTGSGALAAVAVTVTTGTGSLNPALQALAVSETTGTAQLTASYAVATLSLTTDVGTASLTGSGALTALGVSTTEATAQLTGVGSVAALGLSPSAATAQLTGAGALATLGTSATTGTGDLEPAAAAGALSALGLSITASYAQLTGVGAMSALAATISAGAGDLEPFVPFVPPVSAPPAGSVPGWNGPELATGIGPYKRPGQVFGEADPWSPNLTARAPVTLPTASVDGIPLAPTLSGTQASALPSTEVASEYLALILLLALEETSRRA